ncbi:hypothetical protein [Parasitella parasitica]|uniref:Uncharacterized protein n=1 Tax=Parasitella parasitica TaxID=35722 RepID=A0A0B7N8S4_9FUNG|nr:hypothetical protein [Parasitella parasitica]
MTRLSLTEYLWENMDSVQINNDDEEEEEDDPSSPHHHLPPQQQPQSQLQPQESDAVDSILEEEHTMATSQRIRQEVWRVWELFESFCLADESAQFCLQGVSVHKVKSAMTKFYSSLYSIQRLQPDYPPICLNITVAHRVRNLNVPDLVLDYLGGDGQLMWSPMHFDSFILHKLMRFRDINIIGAQHSKILNDIRVLSLSFQLV